ncbi:MAG: M50 family metallopeptidase [Bacteroidales bacterium]|jgi:hypothetical protein
MEIISNYNLTFYILLLVAILLGRIPVLGKFFKGVETMVHEFGHFIVALLTKGEVIAVNLFSDNSGNTISKTKNKFSGFLVSISGYITSSVFALLMYYCISKQYYILPLVILTSISLILLSLSIRNNYGVFWTIVFSLINIFVLIYKNQDVIHLTVCFYAHIIFVESIISCVHLLRLSIKNSKKAGDASVLQKLTKLPAVFWASVFLIISVATAVVSVLYFFPKV